MKKLLLITLLLCGFRSRAQENTNPLANPAAVLKYGHTRFTILAAGLIRIEWDSTGNFVDQASLVAVNRDLPVPEFSVRQSDRRVWITTSRLEINYKKGRERLTAANLSINLKKPAVPVTWRPGMINTGNLKGTFRTLDQLDGDFNPDKQKSIELGDGILSRNGWYLLDDSNNFLFDSSAWQWVQPRKNKDAQDWYFFAYGKDFKAAIYDYSRLAGRIPLPPRYAFGYWWSRYWNYSDREIRELVAGFDRYKIPLDVMVIDMDWHTTEGLNWLETPYPGRTDAFGQPLGWTGYTWNKALFPDPAGFLDWTRRRHLKTTLNLHPASGIRGNEENYTAFAEAMHLDTAGRPAIPFEAADKKFMENLFNIVLRPLEKAGVDFWWLDWQQWKESKTLPGLNNTWWLNYCFFSDMQRQQGRRPLLFHRWGGLGNHRYQVGFSGDTYISWKSLDFQPCFTATASNVLYGYWSHDIGGHKFSDLVPKDKQFIDPELYTRWMQYGALSPVFRTHSSKDPNLLKELWNIPAPYSSLVYDAITLRYALAPYIYTMARKAYDTGLSLCRPLYYDHPFSEEAYHFKNEYMFGDDILVAPVTAPARDGLSAMKIWLPPGGDWYEVSTGTFLKGGQITGRRFLLTEYPLYVKSGAIIPMYTGRMNLQQNTAELVLRVYPGNSSETKLYEDAGDDDGYRRGAYTFTVVRSEKQAAGNTRISVLPRQGSFPGMVAARDLEIQLYGTAIPLAVRVNGRELSYAPGEKSDNWDFTGKDLTAHIYLPGRSCSQQLEIEVIYPPGTPDLNGLIGRMNRLDLVTTTIKYNWNDVSEIPPLISVTGQLAIRAAYDPAHFNRLITEFNTNYATLPELIKKTHLDASTVAKCSHFLRNE